MRDDDNAETLSFWDDFCNTLEDLSDDSDDEDSKQSKLDGGRDDLSDDSDDEDYENLTAL